MRWTMAMGVLFLSSTAFAWDSSGFWLRPDQKESRLLTKGNDHYHTKQYAEALTHYAQSSSALGNYNRGNALARLGRYEEAISAYEKALQANPQDEDAKYNRDLLKKLLNQNPRRPHEPQKNKEDAQEKEKESKQKEPPRNTKRKATAEQQQPSQTAAQEQNNQWLRQVPDDPGGLLRQKFLRDHQRRVENILP